MQRSIFCFLVILAWATPNESVGVSVTPVQKVIQLLQGMLEKGKAEKHKEEVEFADFKVFCDDHTTTEKRRIQQETDKIEVLEADIHKESNQAHRLGKRIADDEESINAASQDINAAKKVRTSEKAEYRATHKDYSESIDALKRAINVLKKQAHDRKQASFVQLSTLSKMKLIPDDAKQTIDTFLMQDGSEDGDSLEAPDANAYEFQGGHIVEMLEGLLDKFIEEKTTLEKEEANAQHSFAMLVQDLEAEIQLNEKDSDESKTDKSKKLHSKAKHTTSEEQQIGMKKEDTGMLSDLEAECGQKAADFESKQQLRTEELQAIEQAIDIMSSGSVSGNADKHLPSMLQTKKRGSALNQLRSSMTNPTMERLTQFLQSESMRLNSPVLSALAVRAEADPFTKVKKMIKDLVVRLMEEANEEAEHKGWCDTEMASNQQTREEKTNEVESLRASNDELEASIAKLGEDITQLTEDVADLTKQMAEATKLREEEKSNNAQTITDAKEAQTAVAQALTVLKNFYEQAGEATAFIQEPYQGMQAESGGVVGMMEVIESDFARLEADTEAAESSAQKEYDAFMSKCSENKAVKTKTIEHKEGNKQDAEQELSINKSDLEGAEKELNAAMAYYEKLKPSCVDSGVSYEDRVARRKEEVESLQEALKILNGEDIA